MTARIIWLKPKAARTSAARKGGQIISWLRRTGPFRGLKLLPPPPRAVLRPLALLAAPVRLALAPPPKRLPAPRLALPPPPLRLPAPSRS